MHSVEVKIYYQCWLFWSRFLFVIDKQNISLSANTSVQTPFDWLFWVPRAESCLHRLCPFSRIWMISFLGNSLNMLRKYPHVWGQSKLHDITYRWCCSCPSCRSLLLPSSWSLLFYNNDQNCHSNHSKLIVLFKLPLTLLADFAINIGLSSYLVLRERWVVAGLRPLD